MTKTKYFLLFLLIPLLSISIISREKQKETSPKKENDTEYYYVLEEMVVTATMSKKSLKDCATSVEVLGKNDLKALSSSSALNILNYSPGIFVRKSSDFGRADVDIRGIGQNGRRIALLVNGRPEKMGLFGCAVTHAFPLDNVERIEVIKGPASVLYGGEALGGVVNIITHLPEKKFETDFSTFFGSFNTQQYNLRHGGNLNRFKYFVTFDKRQSDGHVKNSSYDGLSLTSSMGYDLSPTLKININGKYFKGKKYEPGTVSIPLDDFWNDYERGAIEMALSKSWASDDFSLKIYRNFGDHQFSDGWSSKDYTNGGILRYTSRKISNNVLTIGGDFRFFGGESYHFPEGEWNKEEASLFFHDEFGIGKYWIFTTGLRLQFDSLYGQELCPHLGAVFRFNENTSLRGVINKGFRSPQLNELYMYPTSNPDLEPERVWNYELGFEQKFGKRIKLEGSIFRMKGSNLIETVAQDEKYIFKNVGSFDFYGLETVVSNNLSALFSSKLSYTYLNTGDKTKGRPAHKLDLSLRIHKKNIFASLQGQYVTAYFAADNSEEPLPSYFLLNSRLVVKLFKQMEILFDINNVLNVDYLIYGEFPGLSAGAYQMPGRNIQVGIRFWQ